MTLDFDAGASVQVNATASEKFILRPVVNPGVLSAGPGVPPTTHRLAVLMV